MTPCWDCGERVGTVPAVFTGQVMKICSLCWNKWRKYMHPANCVCDHCNYCRSLLGT